MAILILIIGRYKKKSPTSEFQSKGKNHLNCFFFLSFLCCSFAIKTEPLDMQSGIVEKSNALGGMEVHDRCTPPRPSSRLSQSKPLPLVMPSSSLPSNDEDQLSPQSANEIPPMVHIKSEPIDSMMDGGGVGSSLPPTVAAIHSPHLMSLTVPPQPAPQPQPQPPPPPPATLPPLPTIPLAGNPDDSNVTAINQKYCQTCDISFNYMKTYLAHKQYYCKNKSQQRVPAIGAPAAAAATAAGTGTTSAASSASDLVSNNGTLINSSGIQLPQTNKENLQQHQHQQPPETAASI